MELADELLGALERWIVADQHRSVPHREQARELCRRIRMVVHPQVDVPIVTSLVAAAIANDQQRGRLLPAAVAARDVTRQECRQEPVAELALG